jgi:outer membrane receptor protein involved in Fe transport
VNTAYLDANVITDLQFGIQTDDWSVQLYVDNVLDDRTVRSAQGANDFKDGMYGGNGAQPRDDVIFASLAPPRVVGVRASYKFGD